MVMVMTNQGPVQDWLKRYGTDPNQWLSGRVTSTVYDAGVTLRGALQIVHIPVAQLAHCRDADEVQAEMVAAHTAETERLQPLYLAAQSLEALYRCFRTKQILSGPISVRKGRIVAASAGMKVWACQPPRSNTTEPAGSAEKTRQQRLGRAQREHERQMAAILEEKEASADGLAEIHARALYNINEQWLVKQVDWQSRFVVVVFQHSTESEAAPQSVNIHRSQHAAWRKKRTARELQLLMIRANAAEREKASDQEPEQPNKGG